MVKRVWRETSLVPAPAREQFIARRGINREINNFKTDSSPGPEMLMKVACDALQKYAGQSTRDFPAGLKRAPSRQSQLVSNPTRARGRSPLCQSRSHGDAVSRTAEPWATRC